MAWTAAQRQAIDARGKNLLVAAAAGSGKTAVLVERIIKLVTEENIDVDKLLTVTFTHAAADEMTERIGAALSAKAAAQTDPQKLARLERQRVLLPSANISTLHSFCLTLLRQNILTVGLEPDFRLGLTEELRLIAEDVLENVIDAAYESNSETFWQLAESLADGGSDDKKLAAVIAEIYRFSVSRPFPEKWLEKAVAAFDLSPDARLSETIWYKTMTEEVEQKLTTALADNDIALDAAWNYGLSNYEMSLNAHRRMIENAIDALYGNFDDLRQKFLAMDFGIKAEKGAAEEAKDEVKAARDRYAVELKKLRDKYFTVEEKDIVADLRAAFPFVRELADLTVTFAAEFAAAKREKNLVDFSDLEHFALKILVADENTLAPSPVALALREKFAAVTVDEYQDTNGVQETILSMVASPEKANLFAVGDVKQSIYRFRLADPTLFLQKYHEYPDKGEKFARIDLKQNFRSREEILTAINFLFEQLMNEYTMELVYDDSAKLYPGADYPPPPEAARILRGAELAVIYDDATENGDAEELVGAEREAQFIADRLNALMSAGTMVFDKGTKKYRPLKFRDAVVLMRSVKGRAEKMLDVLRRNGIPAYAAMDAGYFAETEIKLMLSLLSVIDNSRQDIPLAAVLLSPVGGFTAAELGQARAKAAAVDIFAALVRVADGSVKISAKIRRKASDFLERLNRWRDLARDVGVPELIAELYRDTGYYDYVGSLAGGALRQANLRMLIDRAAEYEATNFRSLFRFLRFTERMQNADTDLAVARTLSDSEDVLRIMTIHKSKGLEFPLVFLAGTGAKFPSEKGELILHGSLGFGSYVANPEGAFRYPSFARQTALYRTTAENRAEELRVLYVALTRAREKLIVVGTGGKAAKLADYLKKFDRFPRIEAGAANSELPPFAPAAADSFLAWFVMSIMRSETCGKALRDFAETGGATATDTPCGTSAPWSAYLVPSSTIKGRAAAARDNEILAKVKRGEKLSPSPYAAEIKKLLGWRYDFRGVKNIPAKLSVTELKRRFAEKDAEAEELSEITARSEEISLATPKFLRQTRFTGADYGTIMHSCLQHVDLTGDLSAAGIKKQLAAMRQRDIFDDAEIKLISPAKIAAFFASAVGRRMLAAPQKWRELSFSQQIAANRFFPDAAVEEKIFVQGVIDLLFADDKGFVLVDYKTDGNTAPEEARDRYRLQIDLYAAAAENVTGKAIVERYLFMLADGTLVDM